MFFLKEFMSIKKRYEEHLIGTCVEMAPLKLCPDPKAAYDQ